MDDIEFHRSQLRKLLKKLNENLLEIELEKAEFIHPHSVPLDLKEAQKSTRSKIARIEARLVELEAGQSRGTPIHIPFVIVAMTKQEASDLINEKILESDRVAVTERTRFEECKKAFQEEEIENWLSHYSEDREDWRPHTCPENTICEIISEIVTSINLLQLEIPTGQLIHPQFCSTSFFAYDEDIQEETWSELAGSGCVLIIDAISLFHPHLRQTLSDSHMGSNEQVAMLILSPINPCANKANQLIEQEIRLRMRRAFVRFEKQLDKLCEIGVGDLRALRRWLFAVLPEAANIVQNKRPLPANLRILRDTIGEPRGYERFVFGQGGRQ